MNHTTFSDLGLVGPICTALRDEGYQRPTPIQQEAIPHVLNGRDLLACAQTGTGKTAAFALPILQVLSRQRGLPRPRRPRALILTPTRELAAQIADSISCYGHHLKVGHTVVFGGVNQRPQIKALAKDVDILVATPGRLLDLMGQGQVGLSDVQIFVLDEADRMLDMGFVKDVKRISQAIPKKRQSLLFSATVPRAIKQLAQSLLQRPISVAVSPVSSTAERITQKVMFVGRSDKRRALSDLLKDPAITRALVFTRTKRGANKVARQLEATMVSAEAIHGNKSQGARKRALDSFKNGQTRILVATDLAARGIDVDGVSHVINYDMPAEPETYVHRIGRTARAGAHGIAFSLCDADERASLRSIERLIGQQLPVCSNHPAPASWTTTQATTAGGSRRRSRHEGRRPRSV